MKKEVKIGIGLVFLAFYVFLIMQFGKVFVYYDDFGYLSLSYGNTVPDVIGSNYTLSQLLSFMGKHYFYSNGRLFYLFLFSFLNMIGGLAAVQVFMATSVLAILMLVHYVVMRHIKPAGWRPVFLAAFICLLYGTIGILIQRLGTYWYAASFLYVVPTVTFLVLAVLYYETIGEEPETWKKAVCIVLAFFAAFSQEEWLVAVIGYICMVIAWKTLKKYRVRAYDFGTLAAAVAGALPILLMALMGLGAYMIWKKMKLPVLNIVYLAFSAAITVYLFLKLNRHVLGAGGHSQAMIWVLFLYLIVTAVQVIRILYDRDQILMGMIFLAAILTLACLVVVPELPQRVLLPFIYLSYTLFGYLFCLILLERKSVVWGLAGLVFVAAVSIPNLKNIYRGYRINYEVLMYNDGVIRDAAARIRGGEEIKKLTLYQNPDRLCSCEMVYDENFKYMIYWMDEYYDLPSEVELEYEPITDLSAWQQTH